jgi:hypothetical protein
MSKTISIEDLRKLKKKPKTMSRPAVEDGERKSPDSFVILLDENEPSASPPPEGTTDAVSRHRSSHSHR